ncbi:MAG: 2-dehydropantoate 2-reductase N-terminal domain-containing protein [Maritimibacter sp.]
MKIAVLGAGAMGSVYGARLAKAGAEVTLLDVNAEHVAAVNEQGLQLALDEGVKSH